MANARLEISNPSEHAIINGWSLKNEGTVIWGDSAGDITVGGALGGVAIENSGVFEIWAGNTIRFNNTGEVPSFVNNPTGFLKIDSEQFGVTIEMPFVNYGRVDLHWGHLVAPYGYTQWGGQTDLKGNGLSGPFLDFYEGALNGPGNVFGMLRNLGATINVGGTGPLTGLLRVDGTFVQSSGTIVFRIADNDPATNNYDRLIVTGNGTFGGTVRITLTGGANPAGSVYSIIRCAARSGVFDIEDIPATFFLRPLINGFDAEAL